MGESVGRLEGSMNELQADQFDMLQQLDTIAAYAHLRPEVGSLYCTPCTITVLRFWLRLQGNIGVGGGHSGQSVSPIHAVISQLLPFCWFDSHGEV